YSMLDGAAKLKDLVKETKRQGQKAVALTDHGYCYGAYEFYKAAKAEGVKPIIGVEAYMTPGTSRFSQDRVLWGDESQRADDVSARGAYTHLTLLSYNNTGLHNLLKLDSRASLEGQFGKWPRMDMELLEEYHEGLIATAGCPSGEVQTRLRLGQFDEAYAAAGRMQDLFGKENYFVELMDHDNAIERKVRNELLDLAKKIGAPVIATNDSHYVHKDDASIQDAMLCINSGSKLTDPDRFKFDGEGYHLRSTEEMYNLFGHIDGACENTLLIAERCEVEFEPGNYMPVLDPPAGETTESWFIKEVEKGLHFRYGPTIPADVKERADYEVGVIIKMGFPAYFLVVSDYILWAKRNGIRVGPGRGSGAGSMVAYALQITELDPIQHGLLFERFLNPDRISMPDIDVDFDERRRDEVLHYVEEKYGRDHVSQVVTFGTIKTKNALKDAARVLGHEYAVGEQLTKALPPSNQGKDIPLRDVFDSEAERYQEAGEFRELVNSSEAYTEIYNLAKGLEGLTRNAGVHACAVLMSSVPLTDVIPIKKEKDAIVTQFPYPLCEELGILKMDFLGLSNLTVIDDALDNIVANGKDPVVIEEVGLEDDKTFELLQKAETLGVFQLDSSGMRTLLKQMKPTEFEDISAVSALYRPGPMGMDSHTNYALHKNGHQKIKPIHPELEEPLKEVLGPTYGLIVYQEQVMQIARICAGFTMGQADTLRKAMGKKKLDVLNQQFESFSQGMLDNGYSKECIDTLWEILVPFAQYAFNKSHSACYGVISFWTAYLKANYPVEFMAALLTSNKNKRDKLALYLSECRRMEIDVFVPDVNTSLANFAPVGGDIRFGLTGINGVGEGVAVDIIQAREEKGDYTSFQDFLDKVPYSVCNKKTIEALIKAGAFDSLGHNRRALLACAEDAVAGARSIKEKEAAGQFDLFGAFGESAGVGVELTIPDIPEWDKQAKLDNEKEVLGLYVSDHPLSHLGGALARHADTSIVALLEEERVRDGGSVTLAGMISSVRVRVSKKDGRPWASITLEDLTGSIEVPVFPKTYNDHMGLVREGQIIVLHARTRDRDGTLDLTAQSLEELPVSVGDNAPVPLRLPEQMCTPALMGKLAEVLQRYPGDAPVHLHVTRNGREAVVQVAPEFFVRPSADLFADVTRLLGRGWRS
ncbi:MAG: DNA polymerase III subunit alpha, partial [Actinomycetaceae bacterium]|nr:DNA polymerase III subunit alpha [Actinomycetaceae bacterium]